MPDRTPLDWITKIRADFALPRLIELRERALALGAIHCYPIALEHDRKDQSAGTGASHPATDEYHASQLAQMAAVPSP